GGAAQRAARPPARLGAQRAREPPDRVRRRGRTRGRNHRRDGRVPRGGVSRGEPRDAMSAADGVDSRRARRWLAAGAVAGMGLAALALMQARAPTGARVAPAGGGDVVAWVNGQPIARESFARFVGAVARERRRLELDIDTRRALLQRLIDEELLLQQGIALGLDRREPSA